MRQAALACLVLCMGCTTVTEYEVGVAKTRFSGNVHDKLWGQGLRSTFGKSLTVYNLREQQYPVEGASESIQALTSDQLPVMLDASYRWRVERDSARTIYMTIGNMNEAHVFVYNAYRNAVRDAVSEIAAADVMSTERQDLGQRIRELMTARLAVRGLAVPAFFLREIVPPAKLRAAIEDKLTREQTVQAEAYQTQVVMEQANQRREEAKGIRDAQQIIATSLDGTRGQRYLYWRYLEMLGAIGEGTNNMVIAPTEGGIPLFFGMQ